jgi:predicted  nucleic acid-binding Zn-ribbon protein
VRELEAERDAAICERDEMRAANITPEDAGRPLSQSVEYWQDRCLDHATALDAERARRKHLEKQHDEALEALSLLARDFLAYAGQNDAEASGYYRQAMQLLSDEAGR